MCIKKNKSNSIRFREKTPREYDRAISRYQGVPKLKRISVKIIKNQKEQKCSFFVKNKKQLLKKKNYKWTSIFCTSKNTKYVLMFYI